MRLIDLSPPASSLIESIRNIGYTFAFAIADLVDNSISANAKNISINIAKDHLDKVVVTIQDDGIGMTQSELHLAMSLGGKGPSDERAINDLGRFGLGLKTASFSQAKLLTVITKNILSSDLNIVQWDLDFVIKENKWLAEELDVKDGLTLLSETNTSIGKSGTVIVLKKCDRIDEGLLSINDLNTHLNSEIGQLQKILSLIYHKLITHKKTSITVNGLKLKGMDPFCVVGDDSSAKSQIIFNESVKVKDSDISVTGYLLPHISRMGGQKREESISIDSNHVANQGLYLYRLDRLIAWGSWQNVVRKSEANKLARIDVTFGNDADELWKLDIKKSTAMLPAAIKYRIRDLIRGMAEHSSSVFQRRVRMKKTNENSIWCRYYDKETKVISYEVDRDQASIKELLSKFEEHIDLAEYLLDYIESTFPADLVANDIAISNATFTRESEDSYLKLLELATNICSSGIRFDVFKKSMIDSHAFGLGSDKLNLYLNRIEKKIND
jgi:hypothetical protein